MLTDVSNLMVHLGGGIAVLRMILGGNTIRFRAGGASKNAHSFHLQKIGMFQSSEAKTQIAITNSVQAYPSSGSQQQWVSSFRLLCAKLSFERVQQHLVLSLGRSLLAGGVAYWLAQRLSGHLRIPDVLEANSAKIQTVFFPLFCCQAATPELATNIRSCAWGPQQAKLRSKSS
jgi:hypothetical protein